MRAWREREVEQVACMAGRWGGQEWGGRRGEVGGMEERKAAHCEAGRRCYEKRRAVCLFCSGTKRNGAGGRIVKAEPQHSLLEYV